MSTPEETDAQLRRAATRHHDEVADTVDLDAALTASQRRSRRPVAFAVTTIAVLTLIGGAFVVQRNAADGDVDVAIDEDGLDDVEQDDGPAPPDFDNAPAPIGLGAPDDGKDSVGLPVVVEPATGLTDGQSVSVSGQGFPVGVEVGVVMCTKEAGQDHGARGIDACNIGHVARGTTDSQGAVTVTFQVRRLQMLDGQEVDCASEPGRCIVGMGMISDYDQSGGFAVDFDPSVPLPDPPTAELAKTEGIADGETVGLVVTGLLPHTYLYLSQCSAEGACADATYTEAMTDDDGNFAGTVRLWRNFGAHGPNGPQNIDCAEQACSLTVNGETATGRPISPVSLSFDPSRGGRTGPTLQLLDEGPFSVGDRFRLEVDGTAEGQFVDVQVGCPHEGGECAAFGYADATDGSTVVEVDVQRAGSCSDGCVVFVAVYEQEERGPGGDGPPMLFPEPITVTITG